jgi:peroxiredoxin
LLIRGFRVKTKIGVIVLLALVSVFLGNVVQNAMESDKAINKNIKGYEENLASSNSSVQKDQLAPNITLQNLQGETVELSDYRGKNVVLNFWATWCKPCKEEMPHLQDYYEKYKGEQNVEVLGVNLTFATDSEKNVKQFVESYDLTFPILLTYDEEVEKLYRVLTIPSTFFIDEEGHIQQKIVGPLDEKSLHFYVNELINN